MYVTKERILKILADEGWLSLIKKAFKYAISKILSITNLIIFELDLDHPVQKIDTQVDISFRVASKNDIDSMDEKQYGYDQTGKQYFKDQLVKGDKCILAINKGEILGYVWVMKGQMELSQFNHISLPKDRVYTYKAFVSKKFRGKRIRNAIDIYLNEMFKENGKRFVVSTVAKNNMPSIKTKERSGFKRIGKIIHFRFFGLEYDYIKKEDLSYLQSL